MKVDIFYNLFEDNSDPLEIAKNDILDMVTPLRSKGVTEIPLAKVIDFLNNDPDIQGIHVDMNFIQNAIEDIDGIDIHTNANGDHVIGLDSLNDVSPQGDTVDKKGQQRVQSAAIRAAKKDMD